MAMRLRVCRLDEITEGELVSFAVPGVLIPILLTIVEGELFAGSSMCPHEDVSLESGYLEGFEVVCSAHGYAFDLHSGQCSHDKQLRWRTYPSVVVNGEVYVDLV